MPGRQQEFDGYGSPSKKLPEVSRQAHQRKKPDGQVCRLESHGMGLQVSSSVYPEIPAQDAIRSGTLSGSTLGHEVIWQ